MKKESKSTKDTGHSFADYFKRALNPLLVLLLLSEQPMYVYEMMREISKRSDGRYTISLLYPVIQRLLSQGYVCEGQKAISDDNRVRQYYEITSDGISYLRQIEAVYAEMGGADKILDYADRPSFCLYSSGLSPPRDILIRFSRYQTI